MQDSSLELPEILSQAAQRSSGLVLLLAPVVILATILAGTSRPLEGLAHGALTEIGMLSVFLLSRTRVGSRRPEIPLFLGSSVMIVSLLFSSWHLTSDVDVYGLLPSVVPLALAVFAPLPPIYFLLLGLEVALLHPLALAYTPSRWALDPWACAAISLALAALAASAARSHRSLWDALTRAREKALEATRLKSEFLANMSHEIRTPMTAILGFADELESSLRVSERDDSTRLALRTIQRNGEHLLSLINGILDLSKIEAGKLEVTRTRFSPLELAADVARLFGPKAREKKLRLEARCDGPVPETIQSDAVLLRQVLINLVGNAVKFTGEGAVTILVRLAAVGADTGHLLEIAVEDTGVGLDPEQQRIVFEPFTQVQGSSTREFSGTGLGLSLARRIARLLGGDVAVESTPGRGSRFTARVATGPLEGVRMCLPGEIDAIIAAAPRSVPQPPDALQGRILIAEDGRDNQNLLRAIFRRAGLAVDVVENGEQACERALAACESGEPYDVVLMDMQMPVLDGYEATRRLRDAGYTGSIVALTAHAMSGDRERCLQAGCDDYATKPVSRADLLARIEAQLAKRRVTGR